MKKKVKKSLPVAYTVSGKFSLSFTVYFVTFFTCVGARLSGICMGEMGYMLCSTVVPDPYMPAESAGQVVDDTVL